MIYVFDTGPFIILKHFYPDTFPSLWSRMEGLIAKEKIVSVREVFNELNRYNDVDFIQDWAKKHKEDVFLKSDHSELKIVQKILTVPHFQSLISEKATLKGMPVADPFVIASAKVRAGTVVTQERYKKNAAKIPNVCEHFGVPCLDLETFMKDQGWKF